MRKWLEIALVSRGREKKLVSWLPERENRREEKLT
jgi:hypothetical protein